MSHNRFSRAQTMVLYAYALGSRATYNWAAVCAAVALCAFLMSAALLMTGAFLGPGAEAFRVITSMFVGPLAFSLAVVVLWHQSARLSSPAALFTAAAAVPAWGLAAATAASWSAGFDAANTGTNPGWFAAAALPFLAAAWVAGTGSLIPLMSTLGSPRRSSYVRGAQSVLLAAPSALAFGALALLAFLFAPLAAAAVLFVSLRAARKDQPAPLPYRSTVLPRRSNPLRRLRPAVAVIGVVTLVLGLACAGFALSGSSWSAVAMDSTAAMNLGLAAGALNAVPITAAAGMVLYPRFGRTVFWPVLLAAGAFLTEAAAQFAGAGHPWQGPLGLAAAVLLGVGLALPVARFVPGSPQLRLAVTVAGGLAGSLICLFVLAMAGFLAPLGAAALLVWCFRPPARRTAALQPA